MWSVGLYVVALLIVSITYWVYKWKNPICSGKLPPGSMGLPLIGETLQFFMPAKSLDVPPFVKGRMERYGPIFKTSLVGRQVIVSVDPEVNHYIFTQEGKLVEFWYLDSFSKLLRQEGTLSETGSAHRYIRNSVLRYFGPETLQGKLLPEVEERARECLRFCSTQASVEVKQTVSSMIFGMTSKQLFSIDLTKSKDNMSEMFLNFIQSLMTFPLNIPGTTFHECMKNQKKAVQMIKEMVKERRASPDRIRRDFLDHVMDDIKNDTFVSEEFVIYLSFGLLVATFETIAATLTLAIILLTDHPSVVQELKEEHEAVLRNRENKDSPITWKEYKSMTFTSQVLNETLRMANVAPGSLRRVIKDIKVNGYTIPAGWTFMAVATAVHLNPKTFEDPLTFNPGRWKDIEASATSKNFIPFGGGMRVCAGAEYSKVVVAMFLHILVTDYKWTKIKGGEIVRTPALGFGNGYYIKVSERKNSKDELK